MRSWRQSPVVRGVVIALLLWTAVDLTNAGLCALDNETATAVIAEVPMLRHADDAPASSPADVGHVDDCFCCSHCVRAGSLAMLSAPLTVVNALDASRAAKPQSTADSLYHPPLLLA